MNYTDSSHKSLVCPLSPKEIIIAEKHLSRSCGVMHRLISLHGHCAIAQNDYAPFQTLITSIISQQLSSKAADTIKSRVNVIVPGLTPEGFAAVSVDALRSAGLSSVKSRCVKELAERVCDGRICFDAMPNYPDEEVIDSLVELPGVGKWTAEMFLIFGLKRPDVLSLNDAGLRRAVRLLFGTDASLENEARQWRPYRSVASWHLWKHLDG
ncbi:MAG: DNA-3-methyladenine glycosylase family protein [bacterium]